MSCIRQETVKRYRLLWLGSGMPRVHAHRLRAEQAFGRPLPLGAVVHHADGSKSEHSPLVICQDEAYHKLLHRRMRVVAAGGNPNTDWVCGKCRQAKPIDNFTKISGKGSGLYGYCKPCALEAGKQYRAQNRDEINAAKRARRRLEACA